MEVRDRIDVILADARLDENASEKTEAIEALIDECGWEAIRDCMLDVLRDDRLAEHWQTVANVFWGAVLDRRELPAISHWKGLLHALNHAFNKESMDLLLYLGHPRIENVWYTGDGFLKLAGLVAAGLVEVAESQFSAGVRLGNSAPTSPPTTAVRVKLSDKGKLLVDSWLKGDESQYRAALAGSSGS